MDPIILDGRELSKKIKTTLTEKVKDTKGKYGRVPGLATILVGEDKASQVYVNMKNKACKAIGFQSFKKVFPPNISIETLVDCVKDFNENPECDGILVQMPLPKHLRQYEPEIMRLITPDKDVDGFHPQNIGENTFGDETYGSCTPKGMIRLLEDYNIPIDGQEVVIVNRTNVIGKPITMMFINRSATVTVCHSHTRDIDFHLKRADIIALGVGKVNFLTPDRVKEGVVVLDAGINRTEDGKLVGDADFEAIKPKCKAITPVPGGVGPMTIAMLMENTYLSYLKHNH
ncbi:MAG: bifunctional 5,10-methylenetetrahydrofolate dehydrogenase/5,10-methenyltetrahydrofolate cyclohydrolase [Promethearchaeota archaeon]